MNFLMVTLKMSDIVNQLSENNDLDTLDLLLDNTTHHFALENKLFMLLIDYLFTCICPSRNPGNKMNKQIFTLENLYSNYDFLVKVS